MYVAWLGWACEERYVRIVRHTCGICRAIMLFLCVSCFETNSGFSLRSFGLLRCDWVRACGSAVLRVDYLLARCDY